MKIIKQPVKISQNAKILQKNTINIGYISKIFDDIVYIKGLNYCKIGDILTTVSKKKNYFSAISLGYSECCAIIIKQTSVLNIGDIIYCC